MRVTAELAARQEIEVDIDLEEFLNDVFARKEDGGDSVLQKINLIGGQLKYIPDAGIDKMTDGQREIVRGFLLKQADRYLPRTISTSKEPA